MDTESCASVMEANFGTGVDVRTLDLDSLALLQDELYDIRGKWYDFGVQLQIDNGTLQTIRNDFSDSGDALREVLIHWLKTAAPTWEALFRALRSRPIGQSSIADRLRGHAPQTEVHMSITDTKGPGPVHYVSTNHHAADRSHRKDSQLMLKSPVLGAGQPFTPWSSVTIQYYESGTSHCPECSMMKMPSSYEFKCNHSFKVIIVGDPGVGKTSILNRFLNPEVPVRCMSSELTIAPMKPEGKVIIKADENLYAELFVWDTVGMEKLFDTIPNQLFRDVNGVLIVFDVTERNTYLSAVFDQELPDNTTNNNTMRTKKSWFKTVNHRSGDIPPVKILVGNMIDCQKKQKEEGSNEYEKKAREVTSEEAKAVASQLQVDYIEASSLEHINIDKMFFRLTELLLNRVLNRTVQRPMSPNCSQADTIPPLNVENESRRSKCRC